MKIQHHLKLNSVLYIAAFAAFLWGQSQAHAQTYSTPPTWSPMTMLNVTFDTTAQTLAVVSEASKLGAGVYPSLVLSTSSNGAADPTATTPANFDPTQPWYVLENTAFSRRLGWYTTEGGTLASDIQAAYGAGAQIWIELLSESPGLTTYQAVGKYGVNSNNTTTVDPTANGYSGIFGTGGSSTNWLWNYQMDHNACAVNLSDITTPNELFTANYKLYIGDSSGNPIAAAVGASTTTTWTWQGPATVYAVPEPATWSLTAFGFGLLGLFACRRKKS